MPVENGQQHLAESFAESWGITSFTVMCFVSTAKAVATPGFL